MSNPEVPYVLVHGGGHGAWCWERLQPYLSRPSLAVDLPGRESKPANLAALRIDDFARSVVADIDAAGYERVILVGHSIAGVTLPAAINMLSDRVVHAVFVSCAIPKENDSIVDSVAWPIRWFCVRAFRRGSRRLVFPRRLTSYLFCNGMDTETRNLVLDRITPDAMGVTLEPVTRAAHFSSVPRTYIKLTRDRTIRPSRQDRMIVNLGHARVLELDGGHDAMLSHPRELAELIDWAVRGPTGAQPA